MCLSFSFGRWSFQYLQESASLAEKNQTRSRQREAIHITVVQVRGNNPAPNSTTSFQLCGSRSSTVSTLMIVMPRPDRMNRTGAAIGGTSRLFTKAIPLRTSPWPMMIMIENRLESFDVFGWINFNARGCSAYLDLATENDISWLQLCTLLIPVI